MNRFDQFIRWASAAVTAVTIAAAVLPTLAAQAASLGIGDHAPPIKVKAFVKGTPVTKLPKGKISVVEFWATWCPPCKESIPHLTEMAKKYPQVTFLGVSVWEQDQAKVAPFVKQMGKNMDYPIAMDRVSAEDKNPRSGGVMSTAWLYAERKHPHIPTAFVVGRDGKIDWIGSPMDMEKPLAKIIAGHWDLAAAAAQRKMDVDQRAREDGLYTEIDAVMAAKDPEPMKKTMAAIDALFARYPSSDPYLRAMRYSMLQATDTPEASQTYLRHLLTNTYKSNVEGLNALVWPIVDPDAKTKADVPTLALCLQAAGQADSLSKGKSAEAADTLAAACFATGDSAGAVAAETRAIALTGPKGEGIANMQKSLARYQNGAAK